MANGKHTATKGHASVAKVVPKKMFETKNDIDAGKRKQMVKLLNQQLADTFDLMSQTKHAHWNVKGPNFIGLHKMFDEFVDGLEDHIDAIAERATALGGPASGTLQSAATSTRLPDFPSDVVADLDVVHTLIDRYAAVAASTRRAIGTAEDADDQDTMDLFVDVSRDLDKWLWFLEAHVQA